MELSNVMEIGVVNGGYIVKAKTQRQPDESWLEEASLFTNVDDLASYVKRVSMEWEGPAPLEPGEKIGPLRVE